MPSLCCFWCPSPDFRERAPGETCTTCGRPYDAPLTQPPSNIGAFVVQEPITRGFYGAVYRAEQASLRRSVVLKVVPHRIYEAFQKDWQRECEEHAALAAGTPFVANITDQFDAEVNFGGAILPCHVAVLEDINGPTLETLLRSPDGHGVTPRLAAQLAADLFEILHLFTHHGRFHNDLHAGNLIVQKLTPKTLRSSAIDPTVRAVAIDLGSVLDASRSDDSRLGDHAHIARHLAALAAAVNRAGRERSDADYRIAEALRGLAEHLATPPEAQRLITVDDALEMLRGAMHAADEPWRQRLSLRRFGDAYNAQALESWHVPELWFDPQNQWLEKTTARGPQVITGMRGCGKTMLLRALHFHARAARAAGQGRAIDELANDRFIGLYVSCQRLLNPQDRGGNDGASAVMRPFERLFVAYLRDAVQVLRHLRSLDPMALVGGVADSLRDALRALDIPEALPAVLTEQQFERYLTDLQFGLADSTKDCRLKGAPTEAFGHLADVVRGAAPMLAEKYVLFLLDDVSTRYLRHEMVREVISQLLFQHSHCAFRITTETQALQRVLLSPGGSAPADPIRDYEEFNLGNEVYRLLQEGSLRDRMDFISEILRRRGRQFRDPLYTREPVEVLGDIPLEQIAREIATSSEASARRKQVYRGLRAVQAVCVGDLGDVVKLYEKILQRADINALPVPSEKQSDCFLEHSAGLVHFLNRRDQQKKNLALAFAQAAGELLQRSARKNSGKRSERLRQYTKLYVRVDAGPDFESVANRLLDLLDAGVFVYDGGVPRTKTRDDDPVLQFKLSYRKMLGLASFIGLSDRDRFELSGDTLRQWLEDAGQAKRILLESEARGSGEEGSDEGEAAYPEEGRSGASSTEGHKAPPKPMAESSSLGRGRGEDRQAEARRPAGGHDAQLTLWTPAQPGGAVGAATDQRPLAPALGVLAKQGTLEAWAGREVGAIVFALGFEERALASAERVLNAVCPRKIVLVRYSKDDQGAAIASLIQQRGLASDVVTTAQELADWLARVAAEVVVDSTGLSKPFLFTAVRDVLAARRRVGVVHTLAERHYPRDADLLTRGIATEGPVSPQMLSELGDVLMGEAGPYRLERVHFTAGAPERARGLIASASPKNDRLLHLLDARSYDATRILVPPATTPRRRVARASAELAASAADSNTALVEVETNDIEAAIRETEAVYAELYFGSGANVEVGLTGSKAHAVAFAALAAAARVSYAWYVAPQTFDQQRFTEGVGDTHCFDLGLAG